jgi:glutamate racemase
MIGIFDSGFGGLTVLKALRREMPEYNYIYFGDNARAPYGSKSEEVIYRYTEEAVDFLFKKGAEVIILACNTASAKALRKIQQEYLPDNYPDKKVLGVLLPAAEKVTEIIKENSKNGIKSKVGIIGTRATINSGTYNEEIENAIIRERIKGKIDIVSKATPLLVPLIEEGWIKKPETKTILRKYLSPFKAANVNVLILGCTHYPIIEPIIKKMCGRKCNIVDTPGAVVEKFGKYLERHPELQKKLAMQGQVVYYTSDDPNMFKLNGQKFIGSEIKKVFKSDT